MNAIQKAIKILEQIAEGNIYCELYGKQIMGRGTMRVMADEALTALRGIEAVDVESLKAEVHEACPKGFYATKCEVIDHLAANGYLGAHKLPVINGLDGSIDTAFNYLEEKRKSCYELCRSYDDPRNVAVRLVFRAAQEYASRMK